MRYTFDTPVTALSGIGEERAKKLARLGIRTLRDLVYHFPRAYEKRGDIKPLATASLETPVSLLLTVATAVSSAKLRGNLTVSKFRAFDETASVEVVFFNSPFVKQVFHVGEQFRFYGRLTKKGSRYQLSTPKYEPYVEGVALSDLVPVYPLTEGISSKILAKLIRPALDELLPSISDPLPEDIRLTLGMPTLTYALKNAHFPENESTLSGAIRRLAFDEMLLFALSVAASAHSKKSALAVPILPCRVDEFTALLPYELTRAQKNAVNEIYIDLTKKNCDGTTPPMARILVGDVGSGKTVCAALAAYIVAKSGYQTALMAPTEILARQHYAEFTKLFEPLGIHVELLVGATTAKEKRRIREGAESGDIQILIGTHALLSDKLAFGNLGLVITDEQHRFGVAQRATLKDKSRSTHLLVMSATPIPRTLALAMYGDLDVSRIDEMPKGRMRVDTYAVDESYRKRLNAFIKKQVDEGGQCYIVCPAIETDEDPEKMLFAEGLGKEDLVDMSTLDLKNAVEYTETLKKALPELAIECLHGKMKPTMKDEIMSRFAGAEIDVLVSTTVIEVGINVPNATLMIVENAERFGMSQLHQLRGRVGRGSKKSYCILVSDHKGEKARERLHTLTTVYDGYAIAERDLLMRGPGDFFSSNSDNNFRQSGGFSFKFASLCNDETLFSTAFETAKTIIDEDPQLATEKNAGLAEALHAVFRESLSTIS